MSNIEEKTAKNFSCNMRFFFYNLNFSQRSLDVDIDKILRSKVIVLRGKWHFTWRNQAGLTAYIGQTLCQLYNGEWKGSFDCRNNAGNYYYSYIEFGDYIVYPSHFISYRISNGEKEYGTFCDYLERITPYIKAREERLI